MTKIELLRELKNIKTELNDKFGIEKIALFGSYARDEENENSDIDIAIIQMKKKNGFTIIKAQKFLSEYFEKNIDLGLLDSIRPFVKKRIEKDLVYV